LIEEERAINLAFSPTYTNQGETFGRSIQAEPRDGGVKEGKLGPDVLATTQFRDPRFE